MTNGTAASRNGEKTPAKAWAVLAAVYAVSFMAPIAQFKVPALASWLIPAYGMDGVVLGSLMSCLSVIGLVLAFPSAFICRRFGLKTTTLVSAACLAIGTFACVAGASLPALYLGRLIEGVGIGMIGVSAPSCISVWFPAKTRGLALGIWATWFPVGNVITFNLSPAIANAFGWEAVFHGCIALTILAMALFAFVFRMPDGAAAEDLGTSLREGVVLLKNKSIWILGVTFFVFNFIQLGVINSFYNTYLETACGYSAQAASSITSVISFLSIVTIPLAGFISDRVSLSKKKYWIAASYAVFAVGFMLAWESGSSATLCMWVFILIAGAASGLSGGVSRPMAPILMGGTAAGATMGMGVLQFMQNLGAAVGAPLFGWGYETMGWAAASNAIVIPVCILGMVAALFITGKPGK